jgi:hypothetical protein
MSTALARELDTFLTVEVKDPHGHRTVLLEGLRTSATMAEVRARAQAELRLPSEIDWNLRHDRTGRLLQETQRLGEFADETSSIVELTLQPDASLG